MKNILLIITLFVSWNTFAEEKVWYCDPKANAGLVYEGDGYKVKKFNNIERISIKQTEANHLLISKNIVVPSFSEKECTKHKLKISISCSDGFSTFNLNNFGYATSSSSFGWLYGGEGAENEGYNDDMSVIAWKCESF